MSSYALDSRRFSECALLGSGLTGAVYRANDLRTGRVVAVKALSSDDPERLFELKREFRIAADVRHPNLVELHELIAQGDHVCITMELVPGGHNILSGLDTPGVEARLPIIEARFSQLVAALEALHARGVIHGDLKPSNVLLDEGGRVVVVDFGLAIDTRRARLAVEEAGLGGTPRYMAPERFLGGAATTASDWYAVGAMLVEALTGEPPIATSAGVMYGDVPASMRSSVAAFLDVDPERRRDGADHFVALLAQSNAAAWTTSTREATPFVGRARELATLRAWLDHPRSHPLAITVSGEPGVGKSRLVSEVLVHLGARGAVVLHGQGRSSETVSYPVLDAVVDDLSRHLAALDPSVLPPFSEDERVAVTTLFPILARIPALVGPSLALEGHMAWRTGAATLARLLALLSERRPLFIHLEDAQWLDSTSRRLLRFLWRQLAGSTVGLVVTTRTQEPNAVAPIVDDDPGIGEVHHLALGPLEPEDALQLARNFAADAGDLERIVDLGHGSPFALELFGELSHDQLAPTADTDVPSAVRARLGQLTSEGRATLGVLVASSGALELAFIAAATHLGPGIGKVIADLERHRLARVTPTHPQRSVDIYHATTRAILREAIDADALALAHRAIVRELLRAERPDRVALSEHLTASGERVRAAEFAVEAASDARHALAFERAAELFGLAVRLHAALPPPELERAFADALAEAGRSAEAARRLQTLADRLARTPGASAREVLDLERLAAEQWLRIGDVARGTEALRRVARATGVWYPASQRTALLDVIRNRVVLKLVGYRFRLREPSRIEGRRLEVLDAMWSATLGLNTVDILRSASFQARHTRLALRTGEPSRIVKALSTESAYLAAEGGKHAPRRADRLYERAGALAREVGDEGLVAFADLCGGTASFYLGDWSRALERLGTAESRYARLQGTNAWEMVNCAMYQLWACAYSGDLRRLAAILPSHVAHAEQQDNAIAMAGFCSGPSNLYWLVADRPSEARQRSASASAPFASVDFQSPQFVDLLAQCSIDLYEGDGAAAWARLERNWSHISGLQFLRMQFFRIDLLFIRGLCALATLSTGDPRRRAMKREVNQAVGRLGRESSPRARALGHLLLAGFELLRHPERAAPRFEEAATTLHAVGMAMHAAAARYAAQRLGGVTSPSDWCRQQGVVAPERLTRMLVPALS